MKKNILFCIIGITLMSCATGINNTVIPTPSPPVTLSSTSSSLPSPGQTAGTGQYYISAQIYGTVYDNNKKILALGNVKAEILEIPASVDRRDLGFSSKDDTFDEEGRYVIRGFPVGTKIRITVSKEGYTTISRIETIILDFSKNLFNFGGEGEDAKYALVKIPLPLAFSPLPGDDDYISPFPTAQPSSAAFSPAPGEHRVNDSQYGTFNNFQPASLNNGFFVIGWQQNRTIYYKIYNSSGVETGPKTKIDFYPEYSINNANLMVVSNEKDSFATSYIFVDAETRNHTIYARRYDNQGKEPKEKISVTNEVNLTREYDFAIGNNNDLAIAYISYESLPPEEHTFGNYPVYAAMFMNIKKYDQQNHLVFQDKIKLKATSGSHLPRIVVNNSGETTVMWNDLYNLSIKKYSPDLSSTILKTDFIKGVTNFSSFEGSESTSDQLAVDKSGNHYVTWMNANVNNTMISKLDKNLETIIPGQVILNTIGALKPLINSAGNIVLPVSNKTRFYDPELKEIASLLNISSPILISNDKYLTMRLSPSGIYFSIFDKNGNIIK